MTRTLTAAATGLPTLHPDALGCSRALAAAVAAASRPAPEHPDAELIDLGRRWTAAEVELNQKPGNIADDDECWLRLLWLNEAITALPTRTIAGLAVKARMVAVNIGGIEPDHASIAQWSEEERTHGRDLSDRGLGSLIADLLRLAAEPAR